MRFQVDVWSRSLDSLVQGFLFSTMCFETCFLKHHHVRQGENRKMSERQVGSAEWFNGSRGYSLIAHESAEDVFVQHTAIQGERYKNLDEGQRVEFAVEQGPKGLQATNVVVL